MTLKRRAGIELVSHCLTVADGSIANIGALTSLPTLAKTYRHIAGLQMTCLRILQPETLLLGTTATLCVSSQQVLKGDVKRSACINTIAHSRWQLHFVSAGNDAMVRCWDLERLDRSFAVSETSGTPPPYASYRRNGTVYYCENAAPKHKTMDGAHQMAVPEGTGLVTAVALVSSLSAMVVTGLQSGYIRVLL